MYEIKITVLTEEEHDTYEHLCGGVGDVPLDRCDKCDEQVKCEAAHVIATDHIQEANTIGQVLTAAANQMEGSEKKHALDFIDKLKLLAHYAVAEKMNEENRDLTLKH